MLNKNYKRIAPNTLVLVACLTVAGYCIGQDYSKDLPEIPGTFIDVGTHRLHHRCVGSGAPTVVIDNGIAGSATEWYEIQDLLSVEYRACVYDRAGYAWSEPGPAPRTTEQISDELVALLVNSNEPGPFVFVGHSFGGFTALRMATVMPDRVAGLVLVDSSSPGVSFEHLEGEKDIVNPIAMGAASGNDKVPSTPQEMARFLNSRRKALFVQMDEIANFEVSAQQVSDTSGIKNLPILVVARDSEVRPESPASHSAREDAWRKAQVKLSEISTRGELLIATGSDHFIHLRKPEWLAASIQSFLKGLNDTQ
ncbi:MAG: alpha/beta hydrolase [Pseudomonadota bacterium]